MFFKRPTAARARKRMIQDQLTSRGICSPRVLEAIDRVPRERFVLVDLQPEAYEDRALPIQCDQTISQPFIVALMTELLRIEPHHRVLEIGTGSGYQTAILAELAREVTTIERHELLSVQAQARLAELHYENIRFHISDGTEGVPDGAPYDRIIVTAAAESCPPALLDQLAEDGRLIGPFGDSTQQNLIVLEKHQGELTQANHGPCRFVPLISSDCS